MKPDQAQSASPGTPGKGTSQAFYETLLATERTSLQNLARFQQDTLERFLRFAVDHSPYLARRLGAIVKDGKLDLKRWLDVPVMTREDLEAHREDLWPLAVPKEHGQVTETSTSGSGGRSLTIRKTSLFNTAFNCMFYRMGNAHGLDWSRDLVVIRAFGSDWGGPRKPQSPYETWGPPWMPEAQDGRRHRVSVHTPVAEQVSFLRSLGPAYVNTSAFNAMALVRHVVRTGQPPPDILALLTVGEFVSADLREECAAHLGCPLIDAFSTAECGTIMTQCPETDGYHLAPETTVVEVLKRDGTPCGPGQTGLVTATPLYNYSMPLVRYQSDDLVTVGDACRCGRTAPLISRLHGRVAHQFIAQDGDHFRPEPAAETVRGFAGSRLWQLAQTGACMAEMRLMEDGASAPADTSGLATYLAGLLPRDFRVEVRMTPALGPSAGGKFPFVTREWKT